MFEEPIAKINKRLDELTQAPSPSLAPLFEAARYSLFSGGKRLRPLLLLATLDCYGIDHSLGLDPACAIEMVHTYSLIHDDLPCMDNDDLRRGKPTLHKVYPEGQALLTGDFLLTYAFEVLSNCIGLSVEQKMELIAEMAKRSGALGIIGGQFFDLSQSKTDPNWSLVEKIHRYKTASLIQCPLIFGAIVAKAPKEELLLLKQIGEDIGIAFQIVDDLLDAYGDEEEMGKKRGSDLANNKLTAATVYSEAQCRDMIAKLYDNAQAKMGQLKKASPLLQSLIELSVSRTK